MSEYEPIPSLFATPRETSRAAKEAIAPELTAKQAQVLETIRILCGCTDHEGIQATLMYDGWRARRGELEDMKLVMNSGRTRLTPSGNRAVVWILVPGAENGVEQ